MNGAGFMGFFFLIIPANLIRSTTYVLQIGNLGRLEKCVGIMIFICVNIIRGPA